MLTCWGKRILAGVEIDKSKKNQKFFFRNARHLGPGAAESLARDATKIELIQLKSADFLRKTAAARRLDT